MSLDEALHHVKSKRGMVNPNDGFIYQLRAYEGILKARCVFMVVKKVIRWEGKVFVVLFCLFVCHGSIFSPRNLRTFI